MEIIQIVAQLPPAINGLGDQAYLLAKELRRAHGIGTKFVVCDSRGDSQLGIDGFEIFITGRTGEALCEMLNQFGPSIGPALLHYVGYGYARRGCPFWLLDGLQKWRAGEADRRLVTMFYEVYAFGPPWRSSFWTAPLQRSIAGALARDSDMCRTNMQRYARILEKVSGKTGVAVMPIFSNVGEPSNLKPLRERKRRLVVFGGATWRTLIYAQHRSELLAAFQAFELEELIDIGPPIQLNLDLPIPFRPYGPLSAPEVSVLLDNAMVGVLGSPAEFLGKSSIFAAYAAHGVVPLLLGHPNSVNEDGLREGREYVNGKSPNRGDMEDISVAVHAWYGQHNLASTARAYAEAIAALAT